MTTNTNTPSRRQEAFCLIFYAVLLLVTLSTIAATYTNHPLFPMDTASLAWSNAWLLATVINYYGACLCFCGVVVASEESWLIAILWAIACCTVGSPACCLYVFLWLTKEGGSLRLERASNNRALTIVTDLEAPAPASSSSTKANNNSSNRTQATADTESPRSSATRSTTKHYPGSVVAKPKQQLARQQLQHSTRHNHHLQQLHHYRHPGRDVERAMIS